MSLNAKTSSYSTITNLAIIAAVIAVTVLTKNPMCLLALFFVQNLPVFEERPTLEELEAMGADSGDDPPGKRAYDDTRAGFTA
jgi:hypothetical protein